MRRRRCSFSGPVNRMLTLHEAADRTGDDVVQVKLKKVETPVELCRATLPGGG